MSRCPAIDVLEQTLSERNADGAVARHLASCPRCRARADRIRRNQEILKLTERADRRNWIAALDSSVRPGDGPAPLASSGGLAGYEILGELHRGGQGIVYRAYQKSTRRTVAIKVLLRGAFATSRQRNRFEREIEIAARLRHPNIVSIFESGATDDGSHYFVMNYIEGLPLDVYLEQGRESRTGPRSTADLLRLFCKVCDAVNYAHQRGIIHRDLKPANILIDHSGEPHVLDFGLAKTVGSDLARPESSMTRTGEFMGTFSYAAPEQLRGDPDQIDTRTDVYALGVILFRMLTGQFPYPVDGSLSAILRSITEEEPRRPAELDPSLGDELSTIVLKALAKARERRYQSAGALRRDILNYLSGEPIEAKRDSRWYMLKKTAQRYRTGLGVSAVFVVLVATFGVMTTIGARRTARERDRAIAAERRAAEDALKLAAALADSRIERARSLETTGDLATAERVLWEEFLAPALGTDDVPQVAPPQQPARRRAFWALWELYAMSPCLRTWKAHDTPRGAARLSADGRLLIAASADGLLRIWNVAEPRLVATHSIEPHDITSAAISPLGDAFATMEAGPRVRVWEVSPSHIQAGAAFDASDAASIRIDFSPDGRALAVAGASDEITLRDRRSGRLLRRWRADGEVGAALAFSADGLKLASGSPAGRVAVWDLSTADVPRRVWSGEVHRGAVRDVRFGPDGATLATVGGEPDPTIRVLDARTGEVRQTLAGHTSHVNSVAFEPGGKRLASASYDRSVRLWDVASGSPIAIYRGHTETVAQVSFLPDGAGIASVDLGASARIWDERPGGALRRVTMAADTVLCIAVSPDGGTIYAGDSHGNICVIDAAGARVRATLRGHEGVVSSVAISPDGGTLASGSYDGTARIWDVGTGVCRHVCQDGRAKVSSVAFDPGGTMIAAGCDDGAVRLWDSKSGRRIRALRGSEDGSRRPAVAFSPDGRLLATTGLRTDVIIWDVPAGAQRALLRGHRSQVRCLAFSPDGRTLASGGDDSAIRLWDAANGRAIDSLDGHADEVFGLAFSPDATMLASGGRGRQIKLWDVASRKRLTTLTGHANAIFAVAFDAVGGRLMSSAADGTIGLWDLHYYDRHIAGNLECQLAQLPKGRIAPAVEASLRAWSAEVLSRPLPGITGRR